MNSQWFSFSTMVFATKFDISLQDQKNQLVKQRKRVSTRTIDNTPSVLATTDSLSIDDNGLF